MNERRLINALRIFALVALFFVSAFSAVAQSSDALVGTWKLVSASSSTEKGEINKAVYGPHPSGFLTYTRGGRMLVIITDDGRKPLSVADRLAAPVDERAEAFSSLVAYAGRYTFSGDKVIHHVEVDAMQNRVNGDQVRFVTIQGNRMTLRTPPITRGGVPQSFELVWERLE
jgi:hypothetical protein